MLTNWMQMCKWTKILVVRRLSIQCFEEVSIGCAGAGQAAPTKIANNPSQHCNSHPASINHCSSMPPCTMYTKEKTSSFVVMLDSNSLQEDL